MTRSTKPQTCGSCGKETYRIDGIHGGVPYCVGCHRGKTVKATCECGRTVRVLDATVQPVCKICRTKKERICVSCGHTFRGLAKKLTPDGPWCGSCMTKSRVKICSACGEKRYNVNRDPTMGSDKLICTPCRKKRLPICPGCHRREPVAGKDSAGRDLCNLCLEREGKPFLCPKCNEEGQFHSLTQCRKCYLESYIPIVIAQKPENLKEEWSRILFREFLKDCARSDGRLRMREIADHALPIFLKIEERLACTRDISLENLLLIFPGRAKTDTKIWVTLPFAYFIKEGILPSDALGQVDKLRWNWKISAILSGEEGKWYGKTLQEFRVYLENRRDNFAEHGWVGDKERFIQETIFKNIAIARKFFQFVDRTGLANNVWQVEQGHLNRFVYVYPGYRTVHRMVKFLSKMRKTFLRLEWHVKGVQSRAMEYDLDPDTRRKILARLFSAPDGELKEAIICLLMLRYAQRQHHLRRLKLSDLRHVDGRFYIRFGEEEITLDRKTGELMDRYLKARAPVHMFERADGNPYLFPGQRFGSSVSSSMVRIYLEKYGLTGREAFSSALFTLFRKGANHSKIVAKGLKVSLSTAERYRSLENPTVAKEMRLRGILVLPEEYDS